MLTRRRFAACGLCAATGFLATGANAQTAAPAGFKRTILSQTEGPIEGYVTLIVVVDIEAGASIPRHTHPGVESSYILEGSSEFSLDGQAPRTVKAGDSIQVPTGAPHSVRNGDARTRVVANYVVEKGKPLASPA